MYTVQCCECTSYIAHCIQCTRSLASLAACLLQTKEHCLFNVFYTAQRKPTMLLCILHCTVYTTLGILGSRLAPGQCWLLGLVRDQRIQLALEINNKTITIGLLNVCPYNHNPSLVSDQHRACAKKTLNKFLFKINLMPFPHCNSHASKRL